MSSKRPKRPKAHRDPFEDEFHRLLGRLVHAQFDFNVGLQLNRLGPRRQVALAKLLDPTQAQLGTRLKALRKLILDLLEPAGEVAIAEFNEWFERAEQNRALRKDYVHGRWGVAGKYNFKGSGSLLDAESLLTMVPLSWDMEPDRPDESIAMTMEEFVAQVEEAQNLFHSYRNLSERYLSFAKV